LADGGQRCREVVALWSTIVFQRTDVLTADTNRGWLPADISGYRLAGSAMIQ